MTVTQRLPNGKVLSPEQSAQIDAAATAATTAENARIMGILGCEESKGREVQAKMLAGMPEITLEDAKDILAAIPESVQFRTDTALDRMMANAPAALSPYFSDYDNHGNPLLSIPI